MSRPLVTVPAKADLAEIKTYLIEQDSKQAARYVLSAIKDGIIFLSQTPGAGHLREDLTIKPVKFWAVFSYLIVYDPTASFTIL